MEPVPTDVPGRVQRLMDVVLRPAVEASSDDTLVVRDADDDHAAISVGERKSCVLKLAPRHSGLELDRLSFARNSSANADDVIASGDGILLSG